MQGGAEAPPYVMIALDLRGASLTFAVRSNLALTGVMASLAAPLADVAVSMFGSCLAVASAATRRSSAID